MSEHEHSWELSGFVIDTYPSQDTWYCECGAASHDRRTECDIVHFWQPRRVTPTSEPLPSKEPEK